MINQQSTINNQQSKLFALSALPSFIKPGHTLALGGMTNYRRPVAFVRELLRRVREGSRPDGSRPEGAPTGGQTYREDAPRDLTLLCFTAGYESDLLVGAGCVRRVRSCYFGLEVFGLAPMFTEAGNAGTIEIVEESEASLAFGLRATLANVGFMPGRGWIGTDMLKLRPDVKTIADPYSGETLVAFPAIACDVAVIHALRADRSGHAFLGGNLGVDVELALAAKTVIVTAEEIVDKLDQADVAGPVVAAVVHAPRGAWPTSCHPLYPLDGMELLKYIDACNAGRFEEYVRGLSEGAGGPVSR